MSSAAGSCRTQYPARKVLSALGAMPRHLAGDRFQVKGRSPGRTNPKATKRRAPHNNGGIDQR